MKQFLETLARIPGVRMSALATPDGVPIWHMSSAAETRQAQAAAQEGDPESACTSRPCPPSGSPSALACAARISAALDMCQIGTPSGVASADMRTPGMRASVSRNCFTDAPPG